MREAISIVPLVDDALSESDSSPVNTLGLGLADILLIDSELPRPLSELLADRPALLRDFSNSCFLSATRDSISDTVSPGICELLSPLLGVRGLAGRAGLGVVGEGRAGLPLSPLLADVSIRPGFCPGGLGLGGG